MIQYGVDSEVRMMDFAAIVKRTSEPPDWLSHIAASMPPSM